jgi:hypothetical protein
MAHGLPVPQHVVVVELRKGLGRFLDKHQAEDDHALVGMSKSDPATIKDAHQ